MRCINLFILKIVKLFYKVSKKFRISKFTYILYYINKYILRIYNRNLNYLYYKTYEYSLQCCHPDIIYYNNNYYLTITPYPFSIDYYENPCLFFGKTLYKMCDILNPIAIFKNIGDGHYSDPGIIFYNDKRLLYYRTSIFNDNGLVTNQIFVYDIDKKNEILIHKQITSKGKESLISPAIINYNLENFLYYIDDSLDKAKMYVTKLNSNFFFVDLKEVRINNIPNDGYVWHIAVLFKDDYSKIGKNCNLIGLFCLRKYHDDKYYKLFWASADNLYEWNIEEKVDIPEYIKSDIKYEYKSAIIPLTGDILFSYMNIDNVWKMTIIPGYRDRIGIADEKNVMDAFKTCSSVFTNFISFEKFVQKHIKNPYNINSFLKNNICLSNNGKTVATNSFILSNSNCGGVIGQSCDTAVLYSERGKKLFSKIINFAEIYYSENNISALYGFPNNNSYSGFIKLGWKEIGELSTLFYVRFSKINFCCKYSVNEISGIDFTDAEYIIINSDKIIKETRTKEFFNWKNKFKKRIITYKFYDINDLVGYFIIDLNNKMVEVCDYFYIDKFYFNEMVEYLKYKYNSFSVKFLIKNSEAYNIFVDCGCFEKTLFKKKQNVPFLVKTLNTSKQNLYENVSNWFVSYIDIDTYIN